MVRVLKGSKTRFEVLLSIGASSEVFIGRFGVPKPVGAWSGGLWGSRWGWRWGSGGDRGGPAAPQWRGVCSELGAGV